MARIIKSLVLAEKKPAARAALAEAIHEDRGALVTFIKDDKPLAKAIAVDVLREAIKDKPAFEKALSATGVLDAPLNAKQPAR